MDDFLGIMQAQGHEALHLFTDRPSGLRAVIAIHSTARGPGIGGTRLWAYPDTAAGIWDALRLSQAMTHKAALAGVPFGGAKTVVLADGREDDPVVRAARLAALGGAVEG